ncbi:glycosyltransferase [Arcticibacter pallidicorallinus]|nr:glycosyltransferase family 2 protein [Arcticibacter pallidicorallinus]
MPADLTKQVDIIIPSFRMEEHLLMQILNLPSPAGFRANYILICDNPQVKVPPAIQSLADEGSIRLLVNEVNKGPSYTRNRGIEEGNSQWILFLDDDIVPSRDLLSAYSMAIESHPESLGFVGVTEFPEPFNDVTNALDLNGAVGFFKMSRFKKEQAWAPTANLMLNRSLLGDRRFREELTLGGEDVELLTRNSQDNGKRYLSLPDAVVCHPWWNEGKSQVRRMFRYGYGNATILQLPHIRTYSCLDFSTTIETLFGLVLLTPFMLIGGIHFGTVLTFFVIVLAAELITNAARSITVSQKVSPALIWQMMLHKNAQEFGFFWALLRQRRFSSMCRMIDFSFRKAHPSPFRLNRWKIVKLIVTAVLLLLLL